MKEYNQKWLEKLDEIIKDNMKNPNFILAQLANELMVSPAQLYRKIRGLTGISPKAYIRKKRLLAAKDLLERGVFPTVAETAREVGYLHPNHFSISFERDFGRRPIAYLK